MLHTTIQHVRVKGSDKDWICQDGGALSLSREQCDLDEDFKTDLQAAHCVDLCEFAGHKCQAVSSQCFFDTSGCL